MKATTTAAAAKGKQEKEKGQISEREREETLIFRFHLSAFFSIDKRTVL